MVAVAVLLLALPVIVVCLRVNYKHRKRAREKKRAQSHTSGPPDAFAEVKSPISCKSAPDQTFVVAVVVIVAPLVLLLSQLARREARARAMLPMVNLNEES